MLRVRAVRKPNGTASKSSGSSTGQGSGENKFLHVNLQILRPTEYFRGRWCAPKLYLVTLS